MLHAQPVTRAAARALDVHGDALPTEFLIFSSKSDNASTQGPALFDRAAADAVMAKVKERGRVEYPIDLEHRSLDKAATALTKDAADAMGWFRVALRGGDLWAVDVKWTPEGRARLIEKKQRYTSPAFYWLDGPNGRVGELINVALVTMPATHDQSALVAASRTGRKVPVNKATQDAAAALLNDIKAGMLTARNSTVLAVRVPKTTARAIDRAAKSAGVSTARAARAVLRPLTREEQQYIARHRITPAQFAARKAAAVRTKGK